MVGIWFPLIVVRHVSRLRALNARCALRVVHHTQMFTAVAWRCASHVLEYLSRICIISIVFEMRIGLGLYLVVRTSRLPSLIALYAAPPETLSY